MLEVALRSVSYLLVRDLSLTFPRSQCTALVGPEGSGITTILRLIAGTVRPDEGEVRIGARDVTSIRMSRRPLFFATDELALPGRWSVRHALVAAVRQRSLDRIDRQHEFDLAAEKWKLQALLERRVATLAATETTRLHLARIELLRPAILVADRFLAGANPASIPSLADEIYRALRVIGATVIVAPAHESELRFADSVTVISRGSVVQQGTPAEIYTSPATEAAARAIGAINVVPVEIRDGEVHSVIGVWRVERPPFEGPGVAVMRPGDFALAAPGEESDLILAIEEAGFSEGTWHISGFLTGGTLLHVAVPGRTAVHKGKLVPLRYDPTRFRLLPTP